MFENPHRYSHGELVELAQGAKELFRQDRAANEARWAGFYTRAFDEAFQRVEHVMERTANLSLFEAACPELLGAGYLDVLRCLSQPTVSEDDFKSLSETGTTSSRRLSEPQLAELATDFLARNLNECLFPWIAMGDAPTEADLIAAERAVAALIAEQKTKTRMRTAASASQETAVRDLLRNACGYHEAAGRDVDNPRNAPAAGTYFARETKVAGTKADVVLGLRDGRFMAIECKVSNSEVNSFKRLNHEAVEKAKKWNGSFGSNGIVSAVVLQGVFKPDDLAMAQDDGLYLFWSHRLSELEEYLNSLE